MLLLGPVGGVEIDFERSEPAGTDGLAATVRLVLVLCSLPRFQPFVRAAALELARKFLVFIFKGGETLTWRVGLYLGRFFSCWAVLAVGRQ